jgi:hypothetical protein
MSRQRIIGATLLAVICVSGTLAYAQQEQVLHEYFNLPGDLSNLREKSASGAGAEPPRIQARTPGEAPPLTLDVRQDEPVMGQKGPMSSLPMTNPQGGLDPSTAANKLDDNTDRVDELNYFSSFDPSVIPYKRGVAQNEVRMSGADYAFVVDTGRFQRVGIGAGGKDASKSEDVFWGTFLIKSSPGTRTPIPSVAPDQRILEVLTEPAAAVVIERDGADNFYLTTERSDLVRVNMKIAAPRRYFDGEFQWVSWSSFDRSALPKLPSALYPVAKDVMREIGVSRESINPKDALMRLIEHFRDFEGKPFPPEMRGEDIYYSIATSKVGVCRHRSFAFVITATALGIPSRYVYNEAHAFVEVLWPGLGWRRVDLGGAAQDVLMRASDEQRRVHDGAANDTLPNPPSYQQELDRLADQERQRNTNAGTGTSDPDGGGGDNGGFDVGNGPQSTEENGDNASENNSGDILEDYQPPEDNRKRTSVQIKSVSPEDLRRGESFQLTGVLTDLDGTPVRKARVRILLVSPTARGVVGRELGVTETGIGGNFRAELELPADLPIGRWALRVAFAGDDDYGPSASD